MEYEMRAIDWKRGGLAGLLAGLIFVMVEMAAMVMIMGESPWGPPRMMAAIALGQGVLPPPATFDAGIVFVGMMVHFVLSAILGTIFAMAASRMCTSTAHATIAGGLFGLAIYFVNFYGLTALFPWFAMARNGITIAAHVVFGAVLGWSYWRARTRPSG